MPLFEYVSENEHFTDFQSSVLANDSLISQLWSIIDEKALEESSPIEVRGVFEDISLFFKFKLFRIVGNLLILMGDHLTGCK